jgi:putative transposase
VKKSLIVEGDGGPLGVVVAPANVHDCQLLEQTIQAIVVERPRPNSWNMQHLCLDKGYDNPAGWEATRDAGYVPHIARIQREGRTAAPRRRSRRRGHRARRWVVERTFSWLNRWRSILTRHARKSANYLAMIQLACALLWYRRSWRLADMR